MSLVFSNISVPMLFLKQLWWKQRLKSKTCSTHTHVHTSFHPKTCDGTLEGNFLSSTRPQRDNTKQDWGFFFFLVVSFEDVSFLSSGFRWDHVWNTCSKWPRAETTKSWLLSVIPECSSSVRSHLDWHYPQVRHKTLIFNGALMGELLIPLSKRRDPEAVIKVGGMWRTAA